MGRIIIAVLIIILLLGGIIFLFARQRGPSTPDLAQQPASDVVAEEEITDELLRKFAQDDELFGTTQDQTGESQEQPTEQGTEEQPQDGTVESTPTTEASTATDTTTTTDTTQQGTQVAPVTGGSSTTTVAPAPTAPRYGAWELVFLDKKKYDIDDEDDDVDEITFKGDVCDDVYAASRVTVSCRRTTELKTNTADWLGRSKCRPSSCTLGQTCVLWHDDEKSSGSLNLYTATYSCQ